MGLDVSGFFDYAPLSTCFLGILPQRLMSPQLENHEAVEPYLGDAVHLSSPVVIKVIDVLEKVSLLKINGIYHRWMS